MDSKKSPCLICYQPLSDQEADYHLKCARKVFGVNWIPEIEYSLQDFPLIAQEMAGQMSISGVQPKISVSLDKKTKSIQKAPTGGTFILKPQNDRFPNLPENEDLCMKLAELYRIEIPPHALIRLRDGSLAYLVKRFDRLPDETKLHVEDFTQILEIRDKYAGSYEKIGKGILKFCDNNYLDLTYFLERLLVCFVIGNGDMHAKNFSLMTTAKTEIILSPAYDLISSKLVIPSEPDLSLTLNGKKNKLRRKDFLAFGLSLGLSQKAIENSLARLLSLEGEFRGWIEHSFLPSEQREKLIQIMGERLRRIK